MISQSSTRKTIWKLPVFLGCLTLAVATLLSGAANGATLLSESFTGADGMLPTSWQSADTAGIMISRIDDNSFEQQRIGSVVGNGFATYIIDDDTDRGVWRDVNVVTTLRYNSQMLGGLVLRGQGSSAAAVQSDDFYHVRLNDQVLELYRVTDGSFTLLGSDSTGGVFTTTLDRQLRVQIANIANPATDQVRIQAQLMSTDGITAVRDLDFTDTSADAITRAGTVGYRTRTSFPSSIGNRVVNDDLSVVTTNPSLLWYEDYYDSAAPRETTVLDGVDASVQNGKRVFRAIGEGDTGISMVDFDSFTSQSGWTDVVASTLMRWTTNETDSGRIEGGLFVRANGITDAETTGSYYLLNLIRNEDGNASAVRLQRWIDGVGDTLAQDLVVLDALPESTNLFMELTVLNGVGGVELTGVVSSNADLSSPIAELFFLDSSAFQLSGPGTAGFRVNGQGVLPGNDAIVNFDNFTVISIPEPMSMTLLVLGGLFGLAVYHNRKNRKPS